MPHYYVELLQYLRAVFLTSNSIHNNLYGIAHQNRYSYNYHLYLKSSFCMNHYI